MGRLVLVCLLAALRTSEGSAAGPVVTVKQGRVRGGLVRVRGTETRVNQFLAVPFAKPPVGPLRLAAPQEAEPWEGERQALQQPPMCVQDPDVVASVSQIMSLQFRPPAVSEDCLYLNVYSPAGTSRGDKLPVMVWIHGGGLAMGAASQFDGAPLAAYENIITVVVQYRLGILGFLSTGDQHARGNWGLLDQLAALRWVQDNIQAFGGDPQAVTVAGESAGAISASILTLSPKAEGLFQRAVFQSGVATVGSYTIKDPLPQAQIVANLTGCNHSSTEDMIRCVKGKTQEDLVHVTKQMKIFLGAVVDGDFLTDTAEELLKRQEVLKVPVLMGITNHEFGWILPQSFAPPGWDKGMSRDSVLAVVDMFNPGGIPLANSLITDEYLRDARTPEEVRDRFTEVIGDILMMLPVLSVAGHLSDAGVPVYLYQFAYRADLHRHSRPGFVRADHADDVAFVFGSCFWDGHTKLMGNITKEDEDVCRTMMSYWASFIRTGSPSGASRLHWPQYGRERQEYLELGRTQTLRQRLKEDAFRFFTVVLPQRLKEREAGAM